jgi:hypothetical protein
MNVDADPDGSIGDIFRHILGQVVNEQFTHFNCYSGSFPVLNIPAGSFVRGFDKLRPIATSSAPSSILVKDHIIQLGVVNPATGVLTLGPVQ